MQINEDELKFLQAVYLTFGETFDYADIWRHDKLRKMYGSDRIRHISDLFDDGSLGHRNGTIYTLRGYPSEI